VSIIGKESTEFGESEKRRKSMERILNRWESEPNTPSNCNTPTHKTSVDNSQHSYLFENGQTVSNADRKSIVGEIHLFGHTTGAFVHAVFGQERGINPTNAQRGH